jgi:hypothetical protein
VILGGTSLVLEGAFPQGVLAVVISLLAVTFLAISFNLQRRLVAAKSDVARSVELGRAMPKLAEATADLARAALAAEHSSEAFVAHTESAVRVLAEMYGIVTAFSCRVTVMAPHDRRVGRAMVAGPSASQAFHG